MKVGGWLALVSSLLVITAIAKADVDPNSYQLDLVRAEMAHGQLFSWDGKPLGDRHPWLIGPGKHSQNETLDGISEAKVRELWSTTVEDWQALYRATCDEELFSKVAIYGYCYNSDRDLIAIANDLGLLIEANRDLTYRDNAINACGHSFMGDVMLAYCANGGKKLKRKLTLGSPLLGASLADKKCIEEVVRKVYGPIAPIVLAAIAKRNVEFDAPGHRWLAEGYEPMMQLHERYSLDDSWYLYAGVIEPLPNKPAAKAVNAAMIVDAVLLANGMGQEPHAYKLSALLIQESGELGGSDGMVSKRSALAEGVAGDKVHRRLMKGHNHSDMLQGWGGSLALHAQTLQDMVDFAPSSFKELLGSALWLPALPQVDVWVDTPTVDWPSMRCAGWTSDGALVVAEAQWKNPKTIYLPVGDCSQAAWYGGGLLVTVLTAEGSDICLINWSGEMTQFTFDGKSSAAGGSSDGKEIGYISSEKLWLRLSDGMVKCLVSDGVESDISVMVDDRTVRWYQGNIDSGYTLRSVPLSASDRPLVLTKSSNKSFIGAPFAFNGTPMYVDFGFEADLSDEANRLRLVPTGEWQWGRLSLNVPLQVLGRLRKIGSTSGNSRIDQLAIDSETGDVYILVDGMSRWIDTASVAGEFDRWQKWLRGNIRRAIGFDPPADGGSTEGREYEIQTPFETWAVEGSPVLGMAVR